MIQEVHTILKPGEMANREYHLKEIERELKNSVLIPFTRTAKDKAEKQKLKLAKAQYEAGLEGYYGKNFRSNPESLKQFKAYGLNRPDIKRFIKEN